MRIRGILVTCMCLALCALATTQAWSGEDEKPAAPSGGMPGMTPEMMAQMKECMKNMKPGDHHKLLDSFVGSWKTTTKMWMMGEGSGTPISNDGTSDVKWILGGRFIMEEHHGSMMMPNDKGEMVMAPYEGVGMTGYDNDRNMYVGTWLQNMSTTMLMIKGGASPDGKTITTYGEMDEPMLKIYGRYIKCVNTIVSKDKHVFSLYDLHAGENYKVIEITYERK